MRRILGEVVVLAMAVPLSVAVLAPGVEIVASGVLPAPRDSAFLILGMVYGMVAPIGYFLAEVWWRRAVAVVGAAVAAGAIGGISYLFETKRTVEGLALLGILLCAVVAMAITAAALRRVRQRAVSQVEDGAVAVVLEVAHAAHAAGGSQSDYAQAARLAEHLALAAVWTAAREAEGRGDAMLRIDEALAVLESDFVGNSIIPAAPFAARLIGEMRQCFSPSLRVGRREASGLAPETARAPLFQPL